MRSVLRATSQLHYLFDKLPSSQTHHTMLSQPTTCRQEGVRLFTEGSSHAQTALHVASFQSFSEVCVLLLIVAAFIVAGIACARLITSRLLSVEHSSMAAATGRTLWLRMVGTTAFVFAAFLLRSIFSTLYAVAYLYQDVEATTQPLPRPCSSNTNPLFKCDACSQAHANESAPKNVSARCEY